MKHLLFNLYYWTEPNLLGKALRNKKGIITYLYVDKEDELLGYNIYSCLFKKFYYKVL